MTGELVLEVTDLVANVFTGIYSEETGRRQPLRISIRATLAPEPCYAPDTPLSASVDYMHLKHAATTEIEACGHFQLIEAVADHICGSVFARSGRIMAIAVSIVKLALTEKDEKIGIRMQRERGSGLHRHSDTIRYLNGGAREMMGE